MTRCVVSAAMVPRSGPCTEGWRMVKPRTLSS